MTQETPNQTSSNHRLGILAELIRNAQLVWRLLKDPRVSLLSKLIIPGLVGIYILSPIDVLPDMLPVLGQIDDIAVLLAGAALFIEMCPPRLVQEHRAALAGEAMRDRNDVEAGETVDAEYRVID
jgi:uncharacterized membrane protein YkvA (DUF1232 family)